MAGRTVTKIPVLPKLAPNKQMQRMNLRVASYARVSTDHEDQQSSIAAQKDYYTKQIEQHPGWNFVGVYADEGVSGLGVKGRTGFTQMMTDCSEGKIDLILTKSISRFARNTVDSITAIRSLKEKGIGVFFEKENIFTLDAKGEFLLTIMSSLAQEESRSISENVRWGKRKTFADGKSSLAYSRFLGYDKGDEKFEMVLNREQARVVRSIYHEFLQGFTPHQIAAHLTERGVPTPAGMEEWSQSTVRSILTNEKYKGSALLQKTFKPDYLSKQCRKNEGQLPQYYIEEDHEAIIAPWLFDYVQERMKARGDCAGRYSGVLLFSSKIFCGKCGARFGSKPWHSTTTNDLAWQCKNRFRKKERCRSQHIYDKHLHYIVHDACRSLIKDRGVDKMITDILGDAIPEERMPGVENAMCNFLLGDVWQLYSDEDDLSVIIRRMTVETDKTMKIRMLDDTEIKYQMQKFSPKRGFYE